MSSQYDNENGITVYIFQSQHEIILTSGWKVVCPMRYAVAVQVILFPAPRDLATTGNAVATALMSRDCIKYIMAKHE
jgi:hypothetical protein